MSKKVSTNGEVLAFDSRRSIRKARQSVSRKSRPMFFDKARATHHLTDCMYGYGLKPLKDIELTSVYALFAWVANEQGAAEETVRSMTETRFGVSEVKELQQKDYEEVIKFLVDLRIDEMRH